MLQNGDGPSFVPRYFLIFHLHLLLLLLRVFLFFCNSVLLQNESLFARIVQENIIALGNNFLNVNQNQTHINQLHVSLFVSALVAVVTQVSAQCRTGKYSYTSVQRVPGKLRIELT